jgi:cytochrome b subunit of formate dehydrogenase/nitrate/TMAO reductase-like tetraheme cytochrome c subunit
MRSISWPLLALRLVLLVAIAVWTQDGDAQPATPLDNATCLGCHGVPGFTMRRADGSARSLFTSEEQFAASAHGKTLRCVDCHTSITDLPHKAVSKTPAEWNSVRLGIDKNCVTCHADAAKGYLETYHGAVITLGFVNGATCADCHGSHGVLRAGDPASTVNPANLLKTCRTCHRDATPGFATYQPHATTDDFARYPYTWIASKFVNVAVGGVLLFFWAHSALWFYREYRERRAQTLRPHVRSEALPVGEGRHYRRWSPMWRWAHLLFAISIILLVATGITLLYPNTTWAPILERAMGGPVIAGYIHRIAAAVMVGVFAWHIVYVAIHLAQNWKNFKVFGPYSLMPNLQDGSDIVAMFKWFIGKRSRPAFDHWNYQQKVDYWAPFWGIAMLVTTGAMLWFKSLTAAFLPGWVFNVASVAHGDEAVLAAAYLFTVHYFVNHWRPDKFPLDLVMFTGSMPLDEFKREYAVEYDRMVASGQLEKYLVDAPSRPLTLGSTVLGFGLVVVGLALFIMMLAGFGNNLFAG